MLTQPKMNNVSLSESAISRCDNLGHYSKRETGDALPLLFPPFFFLYRYATYLSHFLRFRFRLCARGNIKINIVTQIILVCEFFKDFVKRGVIMYYTLKG